MKKILYLSAMAVMLFTASCKKEKKNTGTNTGGNNGPTYTIPEQNKAWYSKLTATWCGPCGEWGWDLNEEIAGLLGTDHVSTSIYGSATSDFQTPTAVTFFTKFGGQSYPNFCLNGENKTEFSSGGGIYPTVTRDNVVSGAAAFKSTAVLAGAGANVKWEGQNVTVSARSKFFKDGAGGEYYLACYGVEDKIINRQNTSTNGYLQKEHHNVFRGPVSDGDYGVLISGSASGATFDKTFSINGVSWATANTSFLLVIWKKSGTAYSFVNCNLVK